MKRDGSASFAMLASLLALGAGCDAIIGLGDEPSDVAPTSSSTGGGPSSTSTDAATSTTSTSSAGGGDGGGTTTTTGPGGGQGGGDGGSGGAGGDGAGGDGGGGPHPTAACGSCEGDTDTCDCDEVVGFCRRRRWAIADTDRWTTDDNAIINRFGRGFAVTDRHIVFSRFLVEADGGPSSLVLTAIDRDADGAYQDLVLDDTEETLATIAGSPDGVVLVGQHNGDGSIQRLVDEGGFLSLAEVVPPGGPNPHAMEWVTGSTFMFADAASTVHVVDGDDGDPACAYGSSLAPGAPADATVYAGNFVTLLYQTNAAEGFPVSQTCPGNDPTPASQTVTTGAFVRSYGITASGPDVFLSASVNGNNVAFRGGQPDRRVIVYPSGALAAVGDQLFVAAAGGGIRSCPVPLPSTIAGCDEIASALEVGFVGHLMLRGGGLFSVGYRGAGGGGEVGDAVVTCLAPPAEGP